MEKIELKQTLPSVFAGQNDVYSDIWHKQVEFIKGQSYLIEAASGTGKSSLCSFIYGYRKDYQGIICFNGENIRNLSSKDWDNIRQNSIGMMFQELRLFGELNAGENVLLKNNLTSFREISQIKQWFDELGIADKWTEPVSKMSFGQQQRVAFIRMLCQPADFLFLDEPVSHLDEDNGRIMSSILDSEIKKRGVGVIVTSIGHRLEMNYSNILKL